jgi:cytoskeletal protein RodZ
VVADEKEGIANGGERDAAAAAGPGERPVGQLLIEARTQRGLSAADITAQTRIPPLYLKAIETDNYGLISDQLYLLPFLRRYATFVGLDPEDIASRFIQSVQRAETNVVRMSEPIAMSPPRKRSAVRGVAVGLVLAVAAAIAILFVLVKMGMLRGVTIPGLSAAHKAASFQAAKAPAVPFSTSIRPAPAGAPTGAAPEAGADPAASSHPAD